MVLNGTEIATGAAFDKNRARKKVGIPHDCFCLGFIGNIYNRYDFSTTFQAITKCHDALPHLHFVVIGDGPIRSELDREINKLGLENKIIFTGYIQQEEFGRILPAIDIGLLLLTEKDATRYGPVTTKLSTYAYYKLPVITAGFSLQGYPDELIRALYLIPPGDTKALADMIIWLYRHPEERYRNAKVLHEFVMHKLTWDAVVRNILEIMKTDSITTDGG
ncbi:MAG: glycosyltransferase [Desulfobacterales bacterium]|nr:glycosyltransferase [Desulfobacterales bacterium]